MKPLKTSEQSTTSTISKEYKPKKRTQSQNNALHLFFKFLADELNNSGQTVQMVLKHKMEIDWNTRLIKELLWRPAQIAILDKDSTTELSKIGEIEQIYDHLARHLAEKCKVIIPPWPNDPDIAPLLNKEYDLPITHEEYAKRN